MTANLRDTLKTLIVWMAAICVLVNTGVSFTRFEDWRMSMFGVAVLGVAVLLTLLVWNRRLTRPRTAQLPPPEPAPAVEEKEQV